MRLYHGHYLCGHSKGQHSETCSSVFYLERPQSEKVLNGWYMPSVYELSETAERLLIERGLIAADSPLLHRGKGNGFLFQHELMLGDILSSIEIGVRERSDLRFITWQEILAASPQETRRLNAPFKLPVQISYDFPGQRGGTRREHWDEPIIPDAMFGLGYTVEGKPSYRFFALEAEESRT